MHEYMNQAASYIRYIYIYKGRVAASNSERLSARTDRRLAVDVEKPLLADLQINDAHACSEHEKCMRVTLHG